MSANAFSTCLVELFIKSTFHVSRNKNQTQNFLHPSYSSEQMNQKCSLLEEGKLCDSPQKVKAKADVNIFKTVFPKIMFSKPIINVKLDSYIEMFNQLADCRR